MPIGFKKIMQRFSKQEGGFFVFLRAQLSAQLATILDFAVTILLFYLCSFDYVAATFVGALAGAVLNCVVNYEWTFRANGLDKCRTALKYGVVWGGSIVLNTWGTYFFTECIQHSYRLQSLSRLLGEHSFLVSKLLTAVLVGCCWNYFLQRSFVYRPVRLGFHFRKKQNR